MLRVTVASVAGLSAVLLSVGFLGVSSAAADDAALVLPAVPAAVTFTSPADGAFQGNNSFTITGEKDADGTVSVAAGSQSVCATTTESPDPTHWTCTATGVPNGNSVALTATQTMSDTTTTTATRTVSVMGSAPTLDGPGSFVTPGIVSGGAITGATVTVMVNGSAAPGCSSVAVNGYWSCSITAGTGTYTVAAHQSWSTSGTPHGPDSASQQVTVDKSRPGPPVVTSPRANTRVLRDPVTFSGTGEALGFLNVYVDASPVCGASVSSSGSWSCTASGIANGTHAVQAIQSDRAGNFSDPSAPLKVYFGPKAAVVPPVQPAPPSASATPPPATPTPTPSPTRPAHPYIPGSDDPPPTLHESLTNWGTPTRFGAHLPTFAETMSHGSWTIGALLALGFILLVALPLRMLATVLRGRIHRPTARFTGRNQVLPPEPDDVNPPNPWLAGAVPLAVASALVMLSVGVNGEVRYLRLLAAVGVGLAILNVVAVAITTRVASKAQGVSGRLRFLPLMLLAAALAAGLSRWTGLEPPVVAGVLIGVGFVGTMPAKSRAIVNLAEVAAISVIAVLAWLAHGWLGPVEGFWASLTSETLATLCLAGLGSAMILMLPIATLPGRVILEWSAPAWLAAIAIVTTLASVIVIGGAGVAFPIVGSLLVAGAFAALSLAAWSWVRFVEPETL